MDKSIVSVNKISVRSSTGHEFSNPNEAKVVEIEDDLVKVVEKQMENLKLNYQFDEKNVPKVFQTFVNVRMNDMREIEVNIHEQGRCKMMFGEIEVRSEKRENDWVLCYNSTKETFKTNDPEKSFIDHLWFVLRNPNIKLHFLGIYEWKIGCSALKNRKVENNPSQKLDSEKLKTLLLSLLTSIKHQFHTNVLSCEGFNEDEFLFMLKHVKPGTLEWIDFEISWKEEGNYQKMKEIVETDHWKQAKKIFSSGVTTLKIEELFQYEVFWLELESFTPEDVLRVTEHAFNSADKKRCTLNSNNKDLDIDAIVDFIKSRNDGSRITKMKPVFPQDEFCFEIVKSGKPVYLTGHEHHITIESY